MLAQLARDRHEIEWSDARIEKLSFEMAQLRRVKFGRKSEQLNAEHKALFDEAEDADLAALKAQVTPR
ncbi:transposase domain-containing protein [Roseateles noduli]|uniref:transposase domain-containing protein n=1 Tax=Roseateles noduli TaxID=2052484 RepID=UPI003D65CC0F